MGYNSFETNDDWDCENVINKKKQQKPEKNASEPDREKKLNANVNVKEDPFYDKIFRQYKKLMNTTPTTNGK